MPTLTINNLGGGLTRRRNGDINSGFANYANSWGYDPFTKPGNLTWMEQPTSILTTASGAGANLMVAMKTRQLASSIYGVYAIDVGARLNQIRVDNTSSQTADVDTSSVIGTLTPTVTADMNSGMIFYGTTEKIFYGDSNSTSLSKINFDGSGATSIYGVSSVIAINPRPMVEFLGKIYFGNGNNIGEIDSTELITTGAKLSPALPIGTTVRDLKITPDGNYLQITTSSAPIAEDFININTTSKLAGDSNKFFWNGIDTGVTASEKHGNTLLTSNNSFNNKNYTFGYDQRGMVIFSGGDKIASLPEVLSPHPSATFSSGNMNYFMAPQRDDVTSSFVGALFGYGNQDNETPGGLFRFLKVNAAGGANYEIRAIPVCIPVANLLHLPAYFGYSNDLAGSGKIYFTTVENNADNSITGRIGRLWRHRIVPTGIGSIVAGVYETQTQLFSKKVKVSEVRLYTEPLVANNAFEIDLIGSGGSVISGSSQGFTVGTNISAGEDVVKYNPAIAPTYAVGVRVTNASITGTKNWTGNKIEIDYSEAGK